MSVPYANTYLPTSLTAVQSKQLDTTPARTNSSGQFNSNKCEIKGNKNDKGCTFRVSDCRDIQENSSDTKRDIWKKAQHCQHELLSISQCEGNQQSSAGQKLQTVPDHGTVGDNSNERVKPHNKLETVTLSLVETHNNCNELPNAKHRYISENLKNAEKDSGIENFYLQEGKDKHLSDRLLCREVREVTNYIDIAEIEKGKKLVCNQRNKIIKQRKREKSCFGHTRKQKDKLYYKQDNVKSKIYQAMNASAAETANLKAYKGQREFSKDDASSKAQHFADLKLKRRKKIEKLRSQMGSFEDLFSEPFKVEQSFKKDSHNNERKLHTHFPSLEKRDAYLSNEKKVLLKIKHDRSPDSFNSFKGPKNKSNKETWHIIDKYPVSPDNIRKTGPMHKHEQRLGAHLQGVSNTVSPTKDLTSPFLPQSVASFSSTVPSGNFPSSPSLSPTKAASTLSVLPDLCGPSQKISVTSQCPKILDDDELLKYCCSRHYRLKLKSWQKDSNKCLCLLRRKYSSIKQLFCKNPLIYLRKIKPKEIHVRQTWKSQFKHNLVMSVKSTFENASNDSNSLHDLLQESMALVDPRVMSLSKTLQSGNNGKVGIEKTFKCLQKSYVSEKCDKKTKGKKIPNTKIDKRSSKSTLKPSWWKLKENSKGSSNKTTGDKQSRVTGQEHFNQKSFMKSQFGPSSVPHFKIPLKSSVNEKKKLNHLEKTSVVPVNSGSEEHYTSSVDINDNNEHGLEGVCMKKEELTLEEYETDSIVSYTINGYSIEIQRDSSPEKDFNIKSDKTETMDAEELNDIMYGGTDKQKLKENSDAADEQKDLDLTVTSEIIPNLFVHEIDFVREGDLTDVNENSPPLLEKVYNSDTESDTDINHSVTDSDTYMNLTENWHFEENDWDSFNELEINRKQITTNVDKTYAYVEENIDNESSVKESDLKEVKTVFLSDGDCFTIYEDDEGDLNDDAFEEDNILDLSNREKESEGKQEEENNKHCSKTDIIEKELNETHNHHQSHKSTEQSEEENKVNSSEVAQNQEMINNKSEEQTEDEIKVDRAEIVQDQEIKQNEDEVSGTSEIDEKRTVNRKEIVQYQDMMLCQNQKSDSQQIDQKCTVDRAEQVEIQQTMPSQNGETGIDENDVESSVINEEMVQDQVMMRSQNKDRGSDGFDGEAENKRSETECVPKLSQKANDVDEIVQNAKSDIKKTMDWIKRQVCNLKDLKEKKAEQFSVDTKNKDSSEENACKMETKTFSENVEGFLLDMKKDVKNDKSQLLIGTCAKSEYEVKHEEMEIGEHSSSEVTNETDLVEGKKVLKELEDKKCHSIGVMLDFEKTQENGSLRAIEDQMRCVFEVKNEVNIFDERKGSVLIKENMEADKSEIVKNETVSKVLIDKEEVCSSANISDLSETNWKDKVIIQGIDEQYHDTNNIILTSDTVLDNVTGSENSFNEQRDNINIVDTTNVKDSKENSNNVPLDNDDVVVKSPKEDTDFEQSQHQKLSDTFTSEQKEEFKNCTIKNRCGDGTIVEVANQNRKMTDKHKEARDVEVPAVLGVNLQEPVNMELNEERLMRDFPKHNWLFNKYNFSDIKIESDDDKDIPGYKCSEKVKEGTTKHKKERKEKDSSKKPGDTKHRRKSSNTSTDGRKSSPTNTSTDGRKSSPTNTSTDGRKLSPTNTSTDGRKLSPTNTSTDGRKSSPTNTSTDGRKSSPTNTSTDGRKSSPTNTSTDGRKSSPTNTLTDSRKSSPNKGDNLQHEQKLKNTDQYDPYLKSTNDKQKNQHSKDKHKSHISYLNEPKGHNNEKIKNITDRWSLPLKLVTLSENQNKESTNHNVKESSNSDQNKDICTTSQSICKTTVTGEKDSKTCSNCSLQRKQCNTANYKKGKIRNIEEGEATVESTVTEDDPKIETKIKIKWNKTRRRTQSGNINVLQDDLDDTVEDESDTIHDTTKLTRQDDVKSITECSALNLKSSTAVIIKDANEKRKIKKSHDVPLLMEPETGVEQSKYFSYYHKFNDKENDVKSSEVIKSEDSAIDLRIDTKKTESNWQKNFTSFVQTSIHKNVSSTSEEQNRKTGDFSKWGKKVERSDLKSTENVVKEAVRTEPVGTVNESDDEDDDKLEIDEDADPDEDDVQHVEQKDTAGKSRLNTEPIVTQVTSDAADATEKAESVTSSTPEIDTATDTIPVDFCKTEPSSIKFKPRTKPLVQLVHPHVYKPRSEVVTAPETSTAAPVTVDSQASSSNSEENVEAAAALNQPVNHLPSSVTQTSSHTATHSQQLAGSPLGASRSSLVHINSQNIPTSSGSITVTTVPNFATGIVIPVQPYIHNFTGSSSFIPNISALPANSLQLQSQTVSGLQQNQTFQQLQIQSHLIPVTIYQSGNQPPLIAFTNPVAGRTVQNQSLRFTQAQPVYDTINQAHLSNSSPRMRGCKPLSTRPPPLLLLPKLSSVTPQIQEVNSSQPIRPMHISSTINLNKSNTTCGPVATETSTPVMLSNTSSPEQNPNVDSSTLQTVDVSQSVTSSSTDDHTNTEHDNDNESGDENVNEDTNEDVDEEVQRQMEELDREIKRREQEQEEMKRKKMELSKMMLSKKANKQNKSNEVKPRNIEDICLKTSTETLNAGEDVKIECENTRVDEMKSVVKENNLNELKTTVEEIKHDILVVTHDKTEECSFSKDVVLPVVKSDVESITLEPGIPINLSSEMKSKQLGSFSDANVSISVTDGVISITENELSFNQTDSSGKRKLSTGTDMDLLNQFENENDEMLESVSDDSQNNHNADGINYIEDIGLVNPFTGEYEINEEIEKERIEYLDLSTKTKSSRQCENTDKKGSTELHINSESLNKTNKQDNIGSIEIKTDKEVTKITNENDNDTEAFNDIETPSSGNLHLDINNPTKKLDSVSLACESSTSVLINTSAAASSSVETSVSSSSSQSEMLIRTDPNSSNETLTVTSVKKSLESSVNISSVTVSSQKTVETFRFPSLCNSESNDEPTDLSMAGVRSRAKSTENMLISEQASQILNVNNKSCINTTKDNESEISHTGSLGVKRKLDHSGLSISAVSQNKELEGKISKQSVNSNDNLVTDKKQSLTDETEFTYTPKKHRRQNQSLNEDKDKNLLKVAEHSKNIVNGDTIKFEDRRLERNSAVEKDSVIPERKDSDICFKQNELSSQSQQSTNLSLQSKDEARDTTVCKESESERLGLNSTHVQLQCIKDIKVVNEDLSSNRGRLLQNTTNVQSQLPCVSDINTVSEDLSSNRGRLGQNTTDVQSTLPSFSDVQTTSISGSFSKNIGFDDKNQSAHYSNRTALNFFAQRQSKETVTEIRPAHFRSPRRRIPRGTRPFPAHMQRPTSRDAMKKMCKIPALVLPTRMLTSPYIRRSVPIFESPSHNIESDTKPWETKAPKPAHSKRPFGIAGHLIVKHARKHRKRRFSEHMTSPPPRFHSLPNTPPVGSETPPRAFSADHYERYVPSLTVSSSTDQDNSNLSASLSHTPNQHGGLQNLPTPIRAHWRPQPSHEGELFYETDVLRPVPVQQFRRTKSASGVSEKRLEIIDLTSDVQSDLPCASTAGITPEEKATQEELNQALAKRQRIENEPAEKKTYYSQGQNKGQAPGVSKSQSHPGPTLQFVMPPPPYTGRQRMPVLTQVRKQPSGEYRQVPMQQPVVYHQLSPTDGRPMIVTGPRLPQHNDAMSRMHHHPDADKNMYESQFRAQRWSPQYDGSSPDHAARGFAQPGLQPYNQGKNAQYHHGQSQEAFMHNDQNLRSLGSPPLHTGNSREVSFVSPSAHAGISREVNFVPPSGHLGSSREVIFLPPSAPSGSTREVNFVPPSAHAGSAREGSITSGQPIRKSMQYTDNQRIQYPSNISPESHLVRRSAADIPISQSNTQIHQLLQQPRGSQQIIQQQISNPHMMQTGNVSPQMIQSRQQSSQMIQGGNPNIHMMQNKQQISPQMIQHGNPNIHMMQTRQQNPQMIQSGNPNLQMMQNRQLSPQMTYCSMNGNMVTSPRIVYAGSNANSMVTAISARMNNPSGAAPQLEQVNVTSHHPTSLSDEERLIRMKQIRAQHIHSQLRNQQQQGIDTGPRFPLQREDIHVQQTRNQLQRNEIGAQHHISSEPGQQQVMGHHLVGTSKASVYPGYHTSSNSQSTPVIVVDPTTHHTGKHSQGTGVQLGADSGTYLRTGTQGLASGHINIGPAMQGAGTQGSASGQINIRPAMHGQMYATQQVYGQPTEVMMSQGPQAMSQPQHLYTRQGPQGQTYSIPQSQQGQQNHFYNNRTTQYNDHIVADNSVTIQQRQSTTISQSVPHSRMVMPQNNQVYQGQQVQGQCQTLSQDVNQHVYHGQNVIQMQQTSPNVHNNHISSSSSMQTMNSGQGHQTVVKGQGQNDIMQKQFNYSLNYQPGNETNHNNQANENKVSQQNVYIHSQIQQSVTPATQSVSMATGQQCSPIDSLQTTNEANVSSTTYQQLPDRGPGQDQIQVKISTEDLQQHEVQDQNEVMEVKAASEEEDLPHLQQVHGSCVMCNKFSLYLCSSCKKIWYCSPKCQLNHWQTHANECEGIT